MKVWPQCPLPLARLVAKMLKKGRHERHASYAELIAQIESVWAQLEPLRFRPNPRRMSPSRSPATRRRRAASGPAGHAPERRVTPTKSKLPLYSAIAVAVLCLIIGGVFFLLPKKEEPLTLAQIAMAKRAAEARAHAAAPPAPATEAWQDVLRDPAKLRSLGESSASGRIAPDREACRCRAGDATSDGAIRIRAVFGGASAGSARKPTRSYGLFVDDATTIRLNRWEASAAAERNLSSSAAGTIEGGEEYELELRVVDAILTARLNGRLLGTYRLVASGGERGIAWADHVRTRQVHRSPRSRRARRRPAPHPAESWQDALRDPAMLTLLDGGAYTGGITLHRHGSGSGTAHLGESRAWACGFEQSSAGPPQLSAELRRLVSTFSPAAWRRKSGCPVMISRPKTRRVLQTFPCTHHSVRERV